MGLNGIVSVVAVLGWWMEAVYVLPNDMFDEQEEWEQHIAMLDDAMIDVLYAFKELWCSS